MKHMANNSDSESVTSVDVDSSEKNNSDQDADTKREEIRGKLSTMSFEDLLKMKEELGSKVYNATVFGIKQNRHTTCNVKRSNKNRPREISSKIRQKHFKTKHSVVAQPVVKKVAARDPRFDPLCGNFDNKSFKSNYKFVNDIRQKEKNDLKKELDTCTDNERKKKIKYLMQRIDNQLMEENKREKEKLKEHEEKKHIRDKFKKGEKPVFKKKSVKKLEGLIEKYEKLKKSNKLQKHIEKRTKKQTQSDRKKMKFENM